MRDSPFFQIYLNQLSTQYNRAQDLQQRFEASEKKLDELRSNNFEFREAVLAEARTEIDQLRAQISQKNTDLSRLRAQRDEKEAELLERRARESEKMRFAEEVEVLARVKTERIGWLESEVKRLKGKLGAESGSVGYLAFLRAEGGVDGDYIKDLEGKLACVEMGQVTSCFAHFRDATSRLSALSSETDTPDITAVQADLVSAKAKLEKYEKAFGPNADLASDAQNLATQLKQANGDVESLKLQVQEAEEVSSFLPL